MWHLAKMVIKEWSGLSDPALHLFVGTAVYLTLVVTLKRPFAALAVVFALQMVNEIIDLTENLNGAGLGGSLEDTAVTLLPAVAIALLLTELQKTLTRQPA